MKFVTQDATLVVNTLDDGYLSSVDDVAIVDVTGLLNVSIYVNQIGDFAILDLASVTVHVDTIIRARVAGATPSVVFQAGAGSGAGTIAEVGDVVTITFKTAVSTVTDIEALIAQSTLVEVLTPGTGANILAVVDDDFPAEPLVLGAATFTLTVDQSPDGINWSLVDTVDDVAMPSGDNVSVDLSLSDSNGMPIYTKQLRVTLTAMDGASKFSATVGGLQMDNYR